MRSFLFNTSKIGGLPLRLLRPSSSTSSIFLGTLHASTITNTQSALMDALRTFFIIMESNLCIFLSITPGVS
uniref:GTPase Era n=1 Tax=Rhizophora mucronata TaxID=61149 RepID=A0A2P2L1F8_RHIMU